MFQVMLKISTPILLLAYFFMKMVAKKLIVNFQDGFIHQTLMDGTQYNLRLIILVIKTVFP